MKYNNTPSAILNVKNVLASLAILYAILNPNTSLAQKSNNTTGQTQTEQCFKELCSCLEASHDSLKVPCFNKLTSYPRDIQDEFLKASPEDILQCNNSEKAKSSNTEIIEIYQTKTGFFRQAWEKEKKGSINPECEDILIQTHHMWNKGILTKEALKEKIQSFNSCQDKE